MSKDWTKEYSTCFSGKRHCFHNGFRVFISNLKTTFPPGDHSHDEYEFICFKNNDIITFCNGKNIPVKKGYFFPFNSLDAHGQAKSAVVDSFLCLLFAPEIIENAAKEISFKTQAEIQAQLKKRLP